MSDVKNEVNKQTDSLAPIQDKDRIMGWGSYLMLWLGGCISIGTLTMGSAQLDKGLNLMQVFLAVLIGSTILTGKRIYCRRSVRRGNDETKDRDSD